MIAEVHFILHVVDGIYKIIQNMTWYNYRYLYTIIRITVRKSLIILELVQIIV